VAKDLPTSIRLDPQLKKDLVKYAKAQGCSLMWLVADILTRWNAWKKEQDKKQ
jgi:predicted HicB family RNase H-like nuclease